VIENGLCWILLVSAVLWIGWRIRVAVASPVEREVLDFSAIERSGKPNDYLVCPAGVCSSAADEISPVFGVSVSRLREEWFSLVSRQPRTERISPLIDSQYDYVQRSRWFGFPDTITVRFYPHGPKHSTLAIYSRSHFGYWDMGVNRRRIQQWLAELVRRLEK